MTDPFSRYQNSGLQHEKKPEQHNQFMLGAEVPETEFQRELRELLNRHSKENGSGTPDFILVDLIEGMLEVFDKTMQRRANWRGERIDSTFDVKYDEKVKISTYDEHGHGNEIGEAEISIWPGETAAHGKIIGLKAIFETHKETPPYHG